MSKVDGIINRLEPFVHGLGKALLRELREALAQPVTDEQDRAAFEVWMTARYKPGCAMLNKDSDGDYTNVYTMHEWAGWSAASRCNHGIKKGVTG